MDLIGSRMTYADQMRELLRRSGFNPTIYDREPARPDGESIKPLTPLDRLKVEGLSGREYQGWRPLRAERVYC